MSKSANARRLEIVARGVGDASLTSVGFRRTGTIFHREAEPEFVHIVDFGLGPSWSMYAGQFTVDVCVFVGEAYDLFFSKRSPRRPTGSHCELRQRLGMLRTPPSDQWWSVSLPSEPLVPELCAQIDRLALPFLQRLATRRAFVDAWRASGSAPLGLPPRGDLVVAAILTRLGDRVAAKEVLTAGLERVVGQRGAPFYAEIANKLEQEATA